MFTTHPEFKFPIQFDPNTPNWLAVEMALNTPFLIAELEQEDCLRFVLCDGPAQVWLFIEKEPLGHLDGLGLVLPPSWSGSGEWRFTRIARVERGAQSSGSGHQSLVFLTVDGVRYSGSPIAPFEGDNEGGAVLRQLRTEPRVDDAYDEVGNDDSSSP